jgi:predicted ArsR family transcriptional regulator
LVTTRREVLLLLRTRPGMTAAELADVLSVTTTAVRRHLDALAAEHLVEQVAPARAAAGAGRRARGWRLSPAGAEQFPRRYDAFAVDLIDDLAEEAGPAAVDAVFARRTEKLVAQYRSALEGVTDVDQRVDALAALRDRAGYLAEVRDDEHDGRARLLVENNCAVHRVAEQHPAVCSMELALFRRVLGADVDVTRVSHAMSGDAVCCYRIGPRPCEDGADR